MEVGVFLLFILQKDKMLVEGKRGRLPFEECPKIDKRVWFCDGIYDGVEVWAMGAKKSEIDKYVTTFTRLIRCRGGFKGGVHFY